MPWPGVDGAVAMVTGAGQGIGEAIACRLAANGATVACVDRNGKRLAEVVAKLAADGHSAAAYPADVADSAAVDWIVEDIERELGPIGILVNVAGVLRTTLATELSDEDWAITFGVNTGGVFHSSRAVARRMVPRRSGSIITVGSNSAGVPRMYMAAYAASKAAAAQFTKCLGLELAQYDIRCNVVSPGSTDTPMQRSLWTDEGSRESVIRGDLDTYRVGIPLGKLAEPTDVADAVLFLVSDHARHITMQDLYVDGGATLKV